MLVFINDQRSFWFGLSDFIKCVSGHSTQRRSYRLIFLYGHYLTPSNISIVSPSASVMMAFLYPLRRTIRRRLFGRRVRLGATLIKLTRTTLTSNRVSMASLISPLFASVVTSKVYWCKLAF